MVPVETKNGKSVQNIVQRNIETIVNRRKEEEAKRTNEEKTVGFISKFVGSMRFVYFHLIILFIEEPSLLQTYIKSYINSIKFGT